MRSIRASKVQLLAGRGTKRVAALPDLPTLYGAWLRRRMRHLQWSARSQWHAGPVLKKLRDAVQDPGFTTAMAKLESPIAYADAPEFQQFWARMAR